jgi:hypothetical protein
MIAHEMSDLGQLRVAGSAPDYYLQASYRPIPFKSEENLIDEGEIHNLMPPWGTLDWPDWKTPPPVPSVENESYHIRRSMAKNVWPHASTWNLNYQKDNWGTLPENLNPTPTFQGLGTGPEYIPLVGGLIGAALSSVVAYAVFRAMTKEDKIGWKIVLGVGGAMSVVNAIANAIVAIKGDARGNLG